MLTVSLMRNTHAMKYYSVIHRYAELTYHTTWMKRYNTEVNERRHTQKVTTLYDSTYIKCLE